MSRRFNPDRDVAEWKGPYVRYDLIKEVTVCFVVVAVLAVLLAVVFSSPDDNAVTLQSWSRADPVDFVQTAIKELDGTSATATYGPPYTSTPGAGQRLGPISLERAVGVHIPIDTAKDFVIDPLLTLPEPGLRALVHRFESAPASQRSTWEASYEKAAATATFSDGRLRISAGSSGPVGPMMSQLLGMARSGALDGALTRTPQLYGTDYTKPLLFIADGTYLADVAQSRNLLGSQWGMMNETGSYPGQAWLWLYTMWYQVPPMNHSSNGDIEVWAIMMALTVILALVPFIPGLRSIPRWTRVYRLIWRRHYRAAS
ncbi:MAG TPA: hypothetical protein VKU92_01300 [Acidimicrobiales bacterium]|nr:hypothetical protein [Acidimicrobiales bacterium]